MNWILNFAGKCLGLDKGVEKLEMGKAYLGGISLMLSGLGTVIAGAVGLISEVMPLHDTAAYIGWAKGLGHDTNAALIAAGAAMISKGYTDIGNRHAMAKLEAHMVKLATDPGPIVVPQTKA